MQRRLNLSIKFREDFRPFAPVCREEKAADYIERGVVSPYMLLVARLAARWYCELPKGYAELGPAEKLAVVRSRFPAITHVDGSARWQTVEKRVNPGLWRVLEAFEALTGDGVLINTSMNVRGEPIVCTPEEACACFVNMRMDVLVLENVVIFRREQRGAEEWKGTGGDGAGLNLYCIWNFCGISGISERKKEMVAGAADHPDRTHRGTGDPGGKLGACALYLYAFLITGLSPVKI